MSRRPIRKATVESRRIEDRPLVFIGPDSEVWNEGGLLPMISIYAGIVWLKPPPSAPREKITQVRRVFEEKEAHVKLLPADTVDAVVTVAQAPAAPELGLSDAREIVYELCRELAPRAGVDADDAIREVETYLSVAGL